MKKLLAIANEIRLRESNAIRVRLEARQVEARQAVSKALVLWGRSECFNVDKVSLLFTAGVHCPPGSTLRCYAGGLKGCLVKVRAGGWEPIEGVWSRDFVHGLKLSGGLRRREDPGSFYIPFPSKRKWLVEEIEGGLPVSGHGCGERVMAGGLPGYVVRGFFLAEMPPSDPYSVGVLAGILAGSMKVRKDDGLWLAIRKSDEVESVLKRWTVAYRIGKGFTKWNAMIMTSPFYAGVMRWRMPERARLWVERSVNPVWCPLLPMALWQMAFRGKDGEWGMPFPGALPWGRGRRAAARMGIGLKGMKLAALKELGVTGVYGGLRDEMLAGYEKAKLDLASRLVM